MARPFTSRAIALPSPRPWGCSAVHRQRADPGERPLHLAVMDGIGRGVGLLSAFAELRLIVDMKSSGPLTDEEFVAAKEKILHWR